MTAKRTAGFKHEIEWHPETRQWRCLRCFLTSDHVSKPDAEREMGQFECASWASGETVQDVKVKVRENAYRRWIIARSENGWLAWSGSFWVPIDRDGLPLGDIRALDFTT